MRGRTKIPAATNRDSELEERVCRDLAFLFDQYGATVSSNTREAFGNSEVTVAVGNLEFKFAKNDRDGEFRVVVGPRNGLGLWELLHVALAASTGEDPANLSFPISYSDDHSGSSPLGLGLSCVGLTRLASVLEPRFGRLNEAFAPVNYPATHARMTQIERVVHPK